MPHDTEADDWYDAREMRDYALRLLYTSTFEEISIQKLEIDIENLDINKIPRIIVMLKQSQKDAITSGNNYNQTDILNKLNE